MDIKYEAMLLHVLNERGPNGRPWVSITVPGYPKFSRADVEWQLYRIRHPWRSIFFKNTKNKS